MTRRVVPYVAAATLLLGAAVLALFHADRTTVPEPAPRPPEEAAEPAARPPSPAGELAPSAARHGPMGAENGEAASLTWTVPSSWQQVPNPSPMRIATYRIGSPTATGDVAEMSVSRAGGTAEANVQRWVGQFEDASTPKHGEKTPHGVKVTIVEVSGTYSTGSMMMPPTAPTKHPGYTLLGAIAETGNGSPYFFKLVGPTATVAKAHGEFEAFVDSFMPHG